MMNLRGSLLMFVVILVLNVMTSHSTAVYSQSGPVYVNPNAAPVPAVKVQPTVTPKDVGNFITQTVYGFLDFTTTIGNTVMIFSPQSAAPEPPKETVQTFVTTVIETKPPSTVAASTVKPEIKPSKIVVKSTDKPQVISSVVKVVGGPSPPIVNTIVNVQQPIVSKVEVFSSHVEIRSDNPKPSNIPVSPLSQKKEIFSKVEVQNPVILSSHVDVNVGPSSVVNRIEENPIIYSSVVEVQTSEDEDEPVLQIGNNIGEPEYDFLSRQPAEFVEETYRVVNLRPSSNAKVLHKPRPTAQAKRLQNQNKNDESHPTGLVTKLGGTVVKDGVTTVHETSVIGTYISGKYAQVLQSTSQLIHGNPKIKPTASSSLRILKTAAPAVHKGNRHAALEPTPVHSNEETAGLPLEALFVGNSQSPNLVRSSRRPANPNGSFKNRFRNRPNKDEADTHESSEEPPVHTTSSNAGKKPTRNRNSKPKNSRFNRHSTTSVELATVSVFSETAQPAYVSRRTKINHRHNTAFKATTTQAAPSNEGYTRRGYKPKVHPTALDQDQASTSLYKFKLNRTPGRWQYKTTPKPRVTIRKQNGDIETNVPSSTPMNEISGQNDYPTVNSRQEDIDLESSSSINGNILNDVDQSENGIERKYPVETIKVEISTPADFKDTYYEIATIKSPYTFQVGSIKNTRYVTVTSTFEKVLEQESTSVSPSNTEPLTENILATTSHIDKEHNLLDSSIATLPPIALSGDAETPPLETLTETFSTTQIMLKTHILPVIRAGGNTTSYTLIQTYHVTRLVTATKTLPPMEAYQFVPSKTLNEFNSRLDEAGSELHLELDFGDDENDEDEPPRREFPSDLDLSNIGSDFDLSEVDKTNIPEGLLRPKKKVSALRITTEQPPPQQQFQQQPSLSNEQIQQLAILRLLNPGAAQQIPQVITTSKPIVKLETVFESHVIPIFNGLSTSYSTISRPIATVSKTEYEYGTSTLGVLPQVLPQVPINPFQQQQQQQQQQQLQQPQQYQITSTPIVTQTVITATESKILKLTFGAKTAYTTLFSTRVVPTMLTTYVTGSVAVQQTAQAFPGYFPAPYPPYQYVG